MSREPLCDCCVLVSRVKDGSQVDDALIAAYAAGVEDVQATLCPKHKRALYAMLHYVRGRRP